jgi:stearoyl-CoA desaturase (delta-9 desaturase)
VPFAGFVTAVVTLWGRGLSMVDAGIFIVLYVFTGLGVTIGFHRLETHGAFKAKRPLRALFAIAGSMSLQGSVIDWVAAHRRHHAFSDQVGDPHSPHLAEEDTLRGILKGLFHAHMGWLFGPEKTSHERWAPDLLKDPMIVKIDKAFPWLTLLSFVLPAALGLAITRSWWGMVTAFLWGALGRIFLLHHVTWSVNSICHFFGDRPFQSNDESTNNWMLSLLSFGESWHNNHHAFPTSAVHGIGKGQVDISAAVIRGLERLRLVSNVKHPTPKQLATKSK